MKKSTVTYLVTVFWLLVIIVISFVTLKQEKQRNPFPIEYDFRQKGMDSTRLSVPVPDGVYEVQILLGNRKQAGMTTVRAESRRLFLENEYTAEGEFKGYRFCVHKRTPQINENERVRLKKREYGKLNWNDCLDLEFSGANPQVARVIIRPAKADVPVVFLCGNSTVVDQDNEPWGSWGQMIPRFFNHQVCVANFAESGESANTFIAAKRWKKIQTMIKPGDYVIIEFGHNDQKQKGEGKGAYLSFWKSMKQMADEARAAGATPILVTPTQRRSFGPDGKIQDTHLDFPQATRDLAAQDSIALIDLHAMTRTLYEAFGEEASKCLFVHYPAGTWPGQTKDLADNTHFNPFGAYQVAKCVVEGLRKAEVGLLQYLRDDVAAFDPAHPDDPAQFIWSPSDFVEIEKPDGN